MAEEIGLSVQPVRTALKALTNVVVGEQVSRGEHTTKAYRLAADQPFVATNKRQDEDTTVCYQQQDPLLPATNTPLIETLETQRAQTSSVQQSDDESAIQSTTSAHSNPGVSEDDSTTQREDPEMIDPNQDGIPGMLIPLPTNTDPVPATVPDNQLARADRGTRLPDNWMPPLDAAEAMRAECPNVDQALELRKFHDYWGDVPGAKGRKIN